MGISEYKNKLERSGMERQEQNILMGYIRLKRQIEEIKSAYVHPLTHKELIRQKDQELQGLQQMNERLVKQNQKLREDLKRHRKYKCDCCFFARPGVTEQQRREAPCRDCQSPISNYGDAWVYWEPL